MSDITDLEKTCLKQKEELIALKAEIDKFEKGDVSEEYIDQTWERLKSENKVVSPPSTPQNSFDLPENGENEGLTIVEMSQFATSEPLNYQPDAPEDQPPEAMDVEVLEEVNEPLEDKSPVVEETMQVQEPLVVDDSPQPEENIEMEQTSEPVQNVSSAEETQIPESAENSQNDMPSGDTQPIVPNEDIPDVEVHEDVPNEEVKEEEERIEIPAEIPPEDNSDDLFEEPTKETVEPQENGETETKPEIAEMDSPKESPEPKDLKTEDSTDSSDAKEDSSEVSVEAEPKTKRHSSRWGMKSIMNLWEFLSNHKFGKLFLHKVTNDMAPDYATTVLKSMDLSLLRRQIENGEIEDPLDFQHKVMLIFTNALMFNSMDDEVYMYTLQIFEDYLEEQKKCGDLCFVNFGTTNKRRGSSLVSSPPSKRRRT